MVKSSKLRDGFTMLLAGAALIIAYRAIQPALPNSTTPASLLSRSIEPTGSVRKRAWVRVRPWAAGATAIIIVAGVLGWIDAARNFRLEPPISSELNHFKLMPNGISGAPPEIDFARGQPFENDSYNLSQGKRLYAWFGCAGCHGDGRGAQGPSFLDGWWLYGPEMISIVSSIRDGRPHGMPAFRDRMPIEQIWQLAGYVQSIGSYRPKMAATGRDDRKHLRPAENRGPAAILFDEGPVGVHPEQGPSP